MAVGPTIGPQEVTLTAADVLHDARARLQDLRAAYLQESERLKDRLSFVENDVRSISICLEAIDQALIPPPPPKDSQGRSW